MPVHALGHYTSSILVEFDPQHWAVLFFSLPLSLFMSSLSLQTIVDTWQRFYFFKPVLKVMLMSGSSLES